MVQGTGSGVGKSVLAAALCRIFARRGYRVAPFKAQNMSLNSGVTSQGEEMGRAQILQAQAAFTEPDSRMNPVLLKPEADTRCQVVVRGKVWDTLQASSYYRRGGDLWPVVVDSLRSLGRDFDLVIIEGAGSPAEINLRHVDIVNMRVAREVNASVILVGDIEKGGVFASLYGTWALLAESERNLIKGFLINKFRGDASILRPGLEEIERLTSIPVIGVLPFTELSLDDEDAFMGRPMRNPKHEKKGMLRIGVIRLPHLSNFTDFQPLEEEPDLQVEFVSYHKPLDGYDLVILPGSKNTIGDLKELIQAGFREKLYAYLQEGGAVLGVCGGFQMLGQRLRDPLGIEGETVSECGLGILDTETGLASKKTLKVVEGFSPPFSNAPVKGYEIHMGESAFSQPYPPLFLLGKETGNETGKEMKREEGVAYQQVFGTYLHGLFDQPVFRRAFLDHLRERKNLLPVKKVLRPWQERMDKELERIADIFTNEVAMERVESWLWGNE